MSAGLVRTEGYHHSPFSNQAYISLHEQNSSDIHSKRKQYIHPKILIGQRLTLTVKLPFNNSLSDRDSTSMLGKDSLALTFDMLKLETELRADPTPCMMWIS